MRSDTPSKAVSKKSGPTISSSQRAHRYKKPLNHPPKIISLFSGAGGLDLGFQKAGFEISVAIDRSEAAIKTHTRNFKGTKAVCGDLSALGPGGVLKHVKEKVPEKQCIGVIGGPPCQGFSRANTTSKARDPRNKLPALYVDIVKCLQKHYTVEFVVFENVLGIRDKKHARTYKKLVDGLAAIGFSVTEKELSAFEFGVPQKRRRVVLSALRNGKGIKVRLQKRYGKFKSTVRAAIGGLDKPAFFGRKIVASKNPVHPNHWTMKPRSPRFSSGKKHRSDGRSFKQLSWDKPSPTIAFGNREIHVHPNGTRRLSIYEAMLLQGFPKSFVLEGNLSEQVEQVSNAVPPPLARRIATAVVRSLKADRPAN